MLSIHVENCIAKWIRANAEITICRLKHDPEYQHKWDSKG